LSHAVIRVTRPDQAARFAVSFVATPSVNVTPSMTKGNWFSPALRALANADLEADEFRLSLGRGAENDRYAFGLCLHPGLEVAPAGPDADMPPRRKITALPAIIFLLPFPGQPRDRTRRQVRRIRTEQSGQRLLEVPSRDAAQIEHGQQRIETARAPRPFRQDRGSEPEPVCVLTGRTATHLRTAHIQRPGPSLDAPLRTIPMPDDTLPAIRQDLFSMPSDEGISFCPECGRQHTARAVTGRSRSAERQQIPADAGR